MSCLKDQIGVLDSIEVCSVIGVLFGICLIYSTSPTRQIFSTKGKMMYTIGQALFKNTDLLVKNFGYSEDWALYFLYTGVLCIYCSLARSKVYQEIKNSVVSWTANNTPGRAARASSLVLVGWCGDHWESPPLGETYVPTVQGQR